MSKTYALLYTLMLALAIFAAVPTPTQAGPIEGSPIIYVEGNTGTVVTAGPTDEVELNVSGVTVSGDIYIWFAKTGDAAIGADDVVYIGPIPRAKVYDEANTYTIDVNVYEPFTKYVGETLSISVGKGWINFTLPKIMPWGEAFYIKVTDIRPELRFETVLDAAVSVNRFNVTSSFVEAYTEFNNDLTVIPDETVYIDAYAVEDGKEFNITIDGEVIATVTGKTFTEPATDINPEWVWTGFSYSFAGPDAGLEVGGRTATKSTETISLKVVSGATTYLDTSLTQPLREVYINDNLIYYKSGSPTSPVLTFGTYQEVNVTVNYFPSEGTITIKMNNTVLASDVQLLENGSVIKYKITIPDTTPGWYNFTITDNHGFVYWFVVELVIVPYIEVSPDKVHVDEEFTITFGNFDEWVGERINVWIQVNSTHFYLLYNETVDRTDFELPFPMPHATKGVKRIYVTEDIGGGIEYNNTALEGRLVSSETAESIEVLPSVEVDPESFVNDGSVVRIIGKGLEEGGAYWVWIDNNYYVTAYADGRGDLVVEFFAVGFVPGVHTASLWTSAGIEVYTTFIVEGATADDVLAELTDIKADLTEIKDMLADLSGKIDLIELKLSAVNESLAQLIVYKGDEVIAVITAKLEDLEPMIVDVKDDVATIKTTIGEVKASVSDLVDAQAEIKGLIETKSGEIVAVIETKAGDILAKLDTLEELINAGVKADTESILSIVNDIKGKVGTLDDIKSLVEDVKAGQDKVVDSVEGMKGDVSTLTTYGLANLGLGVLILILVIVVLVRKKG